MIRSDFRLDYQEVKMVRWVSYYERRTKAYEI